MKWIIHLLKANSAGQSALDSVKLEPIDFSSALWLASRSSQLSDPQQTSLLETPSLPPCGPIFRQVQGGVEALVFRTGAPDGCIIYKPIVPKSSTVFRKCILRTGHRQSGHAGPDVTAAAIVDLHLPALLADARRLCKQCMVCQIARARRAWSLPPSVGWSGQLSDANLSSYPAYWKAFVDVFSIGDKRKILSCTCLLTSHTTWRLLPAENHEAILQALRYIQLLRGGLRLLILDRAQYFMSTRFADKCQQQLGSRIEYISTRSPWESGKGEKIHHLGARRLRALLRHVTGDVALPDGELEMLIMKCTSMLNGRPVTQFCYGLDGVPTPVTPDQLAYGYDRATDPALGHLSYSAEASFNPGKSVSVIRSTFFTLHWRLLKEAVLKAINGKAKSAKRAIEYRVGQPVLAYFPSKKLAHPFRLCHIWSICGEHTYEVVYPGGRVTRENAYNLLPLEYCHLYDAVDLEHRRLSSINVESTDLPNRVGMKVQVFIKTRIKKNTYRTMEYPGIVSKEWKSGHVSIKWDDPAYPEEKIDLSREKYVLC
ncbi:hypothetical protein FOZ63_004954 [Perkinsus olseni]|uniref:Integrase catalytic domain-containing protein n=1 Tax=Perkinsus olseni TaxID=32597 RepID=A0A7J6RH83_PEROL|nr:hypothetical protein FOZ63_004954 [Perkinsus olseni]